MSDAPIAPIVPSYAAWLRSRCLLSFGEWLSAGCPSKEDEAPLLEANRARVEALLQTLPDRDLPVHVSGAACIAPTTPASGEVP